MVQEFIYLGSTTTCDQSLNVEINKCIGKAAYMMSRLSKRPNSMLTENTKVRVYQACVLSTLLYFSGAWVTYAKQKKRLNGFHIRCLRCLLDITWKEHTANKDVFQRAHIPSIVALLSKRRMRWLGHPCLPHGGWTNSKGRLLW